VMTTNSAVTPAAQSAASLGRRRAGARAGAVRARRPRCDARARRAAKPPSDGIAPF
jgi:hypothetical protein